MSCCTAGKFLDRSGAKDDACQVCPEGKYSGAGAPTCTLCPAGTYIEDEGTDEDLHAQADACVNCPSGELSDGSKYPYFARTPPSDAFQAFALANLVKYQFGYNIVATVATTDKYGIAGINAFHEAAEQMGMCATPLTCLHTDCVRSHPPLLCAHAVWCWQRSCSTWRGRTLLRSTRTSRRAKHV